MDIKKYLPDERDSRKAAQQLDCSSGDVVIEAVQKRRNERIESLVELPVDQITEREIASRLGEIRGLKFLSQIYEECKRINDKE